MNINIENQHNFQYWSKEVASWACLPPIISIDIDQERSCIWFECGGENSHLVRYKVVSNMGGEESGYQPNPAANLSAFSLEEASYLYNQLITGKMKDKVNSILSLVKKYETTL